MRPLVVAFAVVLAACAQDDPTIGGQPSPPPTAQATEEPSVAPGDEIVVTSVEYEFQGVPEALSEGEYIFTLENAGEEPHKFSLALITSDLSLEELIELPESELGGNIEQIGRAFARPDASDELTVNLEAGRYGYVCFEPAPDGTPHAFLGMTGELTVA